MFRMILSFCGVIAFLIFSTISGGEVSNIKAIDVDTPYEIRDFSKKDGKCLTDTNSDSCAVVNISYPFFVSPLGEFSAEQLNDLIKEKLIVYLTYNSSKVFGVTAYAEKFIEDYRELTKEDEGSSGNWDLGKKIRVVFHDNNVLTLQDEEDGYTGGAHGFAKTTWLSLDLNTAKQFTINDILHANSKKKILDIAEQEFRELRDLSADENLESAGFDFPNNTFSLSDNFAILKKGLLFYYNSYDIAAYVYGPTELFISYEKLDGVVSRERIGL